MNAAAASLLIPLYDVLDDPGRWPAFLEHLCNALPAGQACLSVTDALHNEFSFVHAWGITRDDLLEYTTKWQDPWAAKINIEAVQPGEVTASHDLCPDEELESTDVYRRFLRPRGLHYGAGMVIEKSSRRQVVLSVVRRKDLGRIGDREKAMLSVIGPHVRRVLQVHANITAAHRLSRAGVAMFEYLNAGLAVLGRDGRILVVNRIWQESLARLKSIIVSGGYIRFRDSASQKKLNSILSASTVTPRECTMCLSESRSEAPRRLLVLPIAQPIEGAPAITEPAVALLLLDPHRLPVLDEALARAWFGLTAAEAKVAAYVLRGESIVNIAGSLAVSPHTIRSQVKSILAKTGTSRQAELLSLLLRSCTRVEPSPV